MKRKGIILTDAEFSKLTEGGFFKKHFLLDDNGGDPYGNCVIALKGMFTKQEIKDLDIQFVDVYYTSKFDEELASLNFRGKWWAKGCTDEAIFSLKSDYDLFINQLKIIKR